MTNAAPNENSGNRVKQQLNSRGNGKRVGNVSYRDKYGYYKALKEIFEKNNILVSEYEEINYGFNSYKSK